MKKIVFIAALLGFANMLPVWAQFKKVNEICSQVPCENGLFCVILKDGNTSKCATCDQSTLNRLTEAVDDACKSVGQGWTPESSQEYKDALAADGRVLVEVYDKMLVNAKKCKAAREDREKTCWDGGDDEHKTAINQVAESIERMSDHKYKMIGDRRVYYGSKSVYESRLSTFKSKAGLNFSDMDGKLSSLEKDINDGKKVECRDIEKIGEDCQHCVDSGKDLLNDGFSNSSDKFPAEYNEPYTKATDMMKRAKDLLDRAKDKGLCN